MSKKPIKRCVSFEKLVRTSPRLTADRLNDDGVFNLVAGIVGAAVDDWNAARNSLSEPWKLNKAELELAEFHMTSAERFFLSPWFTAITNLRGRPFLDTLERDWLRDHRDKPRRWRSPAVS